MPNEPESPIPAALRELLIEYAEADAACRRARAVQSPAKWDALPDAERQAWIVACNRREGLRELLLTEGRRLIAIREREADQREREDEVRHDGGAVLRDHAAVRS